MIAVTGANGLLGSFIVRALLEKGQSVTAIVRRGSDRSLLNGARQTLIIREADVLDVPSLTSALENSTCVIHAAAMVSFNPRKARKIFEANVEGTRNVVDVCLALNIPRIIHISSVAALGRQKGVTEINEDSKWVDSDLNSNYAESKYLAELELFRGKEEGLQVAMVNPSVILAPADWTKSSAQLFRYVWSEKFFYTEGSLNWVDVRDVTSMVVALLERDDNGERFIANGGTVSVHAMFGAIAQRFGKRSPFIKVGDRLAAFAGWLEEARTLMTGSEPMVTRQTARMARESFVFTNDKAKKVLGIKFRALEETLDWCCGEYLRKINTNN